MIQGRSTKGSGPPLERSRVFTVPPGFFSSQAAVAASASFLEME